MKSANESYFKSSLESPQKSFPFCFQRGFCKIFREKQYIGIVYGYITQLPLPVSCEIKKMRYTFDSPVNIKLNNTEKWERQRLRKMRF